MSDVESAFSVRAAELRRAFDQSFAEPAVIDTRQTIDFISVRLGKDVHAVRMAEIAGLFADIKITPCLQGPIAEFLGIAGFRGALTPVYDLAALLGYPPSSARWIVLARDKAVAPLAFEAFADHLRVESTAVAARQGAPVSRHVHEIARQADRAWLVVDIPSVVAAIKARVAAVSSHKEQ